MFFFFSKIKTNIGPKRFNIGQILFSLNKLETKWRADRYPLPAQAHLLNIIGKNGESSKL